MVKNANFENSTMNLTNASLFSIESYEYQKEELNLYYAICEVLVAVFAVVGNALVIVVFQKERRLRRRTNYYIVSLAVADFLVGLLGIPFAIMSSIGLPTNLHACLFTVSLLMVLCTISIFCLVAVSVDRYWAILYPMGYSRNVRTKTAIVIISICWVTGSFIGFLPLMGWHKDAPEDGRCFFLDVMDYNYLVFLYFGTIITPALLLAAFYAHIYQVVRKQLRQIVTMNPESGSSSTGCSSGGTMLRMLGAAQKREVKATQNLAIIVLFFMICWIPLYTINCTLAFCRNCNVDSTFMFSCIILSHLNSAGNPLLYAYHLKDFRAALKNFLWSLVGYGEHQIGSHQNLNRTSLASNNNCNHYRMRSTRCLNNFNAAERKDSQICYRKTSLENNLPSTPKISAVIKNSTVLAVTAAGEDRQMWNIPEGSSDSSDSFKQIESRHQDKISMVRPATPYRPRKTSDISQVNQAFFETSSIDEESDDVFLDDTFPFSDSNYDKSELETNLTESFRHIVVLPKRTNISSSSPQLSRNLFVIESETATPRSSSYSGNKKPLCASLSDDYHNGRKHIRRSPFRVVGGIFRNKRTLARSLSDEGTASSESISRRPHATLVRSSCGN